MNSFQGTLRCVAVCCTLLLLISNFAHTEAKRGCSSFGHSCFGGHGKRSDALAGLADGLLAGGGGGAGSAAGRGGQDEVVAPRVGYPQSGSLGDEIIPIRNGGFMDTVDENDSSNEQLKMRLSPLLRHWLLAYRKSQQLGNEAYPYNNLI